LRNEDIYIVFSFRATETTRSIIFQVMIEKPFQRLSSSGGASRLFINKGSQTNYRCASNVFWDL